MKLFCFLFLVAEFALVVYVLDLILKDFAILLRHFLIVLVQKIGTQLTGCLCRSRQQGLPNFFSSRVASRDLVDGGVRIVFHK